MVTIEVNNNKCRIRCQLKTLIKLRNLTRIKNKNAYFIRQRGNIQPGWDGFNYYVTEAGYFDTGLLPEIYRVIKKEFVQDVEFDDQRAHKSLYKIPSSLKGTVPRPYQVEALESVLQNQVGELSLPFGILFAATNAGKTIISALTHASIPGAKTILLLNQSDLFDDAREDIPKMLGEDTVGWIRGKDIKWGDFMICMVPTLRNRLPLITSKLGKYNTLIFDECDTALAKTNQTVIRSFFNTTTRIGMSGSVGTHKDPNKNKQLHCRFGDITYKIKNNELIELGHSNDIRISMLKGNQTVRIKGNYREEQERGIIKNKKRNKKILRRIEYMESKGRLPMLIITPRHSHIRILYKKLKAKYGDTHRVEMVHHKTSNRSQIQRDFKEGKIDILVGSYILKRGKNFPLMRYLCNAGGGDSAANVLQILGRLLREHPDSGLKWLDDFWDLGSYLRRHSLHRYKVYVDEKLEIKEYFDKNQRFKNK